MLCTRVDAATVNTLPPIAPSPWEVALNKLMMASEMALEVKNLPAMQEMQETRV